MSKLKNHITPPRLAEKLLLWFLKDELAEEVLGDLDEKFYSTLNQHSTRKAKRNYWYQVIQYLRPFAFKFFRSKHLNNNAMIKHNFKVSIRHLLKDKGYSIINIGGLAIGMVVAMLIALWVNDELSFNKNHSNYESIVQLMRHDTRAGETNTNSFLPTGAVTLVQEKFGDQIEQITMMRARTQSRVLSNQEKKFTENGFFTQAAAPRLLGLEMLYGNQDALSELRSIILSESLAKKLFGDENPMDQFVKLDGGVDLLVKGVYKDLPNNSTFAEATYMTRLLLLFGGDEASLNVWNNYNVYAFAKVNPKSDLKALSALVNESIQPNLPKNANDRSMTFFLHPMKDWHLRSEFKNEQPIISQQLKFVWLYGIIGAFVLLLACINFMNLSTARSEKRSKEVGIRKVLGSVRKQLIFQFYTESLLYSLSAFALSLVLLWALLPWFNSTAGKNMLAPWPNETFWLLSIGFVCLTTLLAGSYPAAYLSSFKPIKALKGVFAGNQNAAIPRKILVVLQFTISIALIVGTITVNRQIQTAKDRPIGYTPKGMISLRPASPKFYSKKELLKVELRKLNAVEAVGSSNYPVINNLGWNGGFSWEGMANGFDEAFNTISISAGYGDAVGLEFISGRDFSDELATDKNAIIINESAQEAMDLSDPIGKIITYAPGWAEAKNYTIIGVVKDMIKNSPFQKTDQSVMFQEQGWTEWLYIRLNPNESANTALASIEKVFSEILPEAPFDFKFADDDYNEKFNAEIRVASLASFFSLLAIFISCLGLFGLASYVAERRTKEIGIRKVMGASILSIWGMLSKDFMLLVLIACVLAIPLAYYVLDGWLAGYEVKTTLHWWFFLVASGMAGTVTLVTVSFQAIKAGIANPVKSLRSE